MMANDFWLRQTEEKLLFPDLAWSKPENKRHAGKLVIIGGNLHGFSAPARAFGEAEKAGIGACRVLLPDALHKTVGAFIPEAEYGPSTPSGSFAQKSLDAWIDSASWADAVLLAGDLGRNSETAIVIEKFVTKYSGQLTLAKDGIDYFNNTPGVVLNRPETTLVLSFAQLQKLAVQAKFPMAFTFDMDLIRLVTTLHEFTRQYPVAVVTKHLGTYLVAVNGRVSSTKRAQPQEVWRTGTAAHMSVWWLQHPTQQFEALTTAIAQD